MDTFISPNWVSTDVAMFWSNNIKALKLTEKTYGSEWKDKPDGAQIGYTVQQRIPQRFRVLRGQALQQQPVLNQTVPISLTDQLQVAMGWSSADDALLVEEVQERYTMPAGESLANECDRFFVSSVFTSVYFSAGTAGSGPIADNGTWTDAVAKLRAFGVPKELLGVIDPMQQSKLQSTNIALFNPQGTIGKIFDEGFFGFGALGVEEWAWDSNMPAFTTGYFNSSTPVVSGGNQSGSSLLVSGLGTYSFVVGDTFTIDGVYGVNPISYVNTGILQEFVVTAAVSGSSTATLSISPSIIADTTSQLQTVQALPANSAALTFKGATGTVSATMGNSAGTAGLVSKQSLIANPGAFAFVSADLPVKLAGAVAGRTPGATTDKVSIRYVDQYNIQTDQMPRRMDCLVGSAAILPYFALRAWQ